MVLPLLASQGAGAAGDKAMCRQVGVCACMWRVPAHRRAAAALEALMMWLVATDPRECVLVTHRHADPTLPAGQSAAATEEA